MTIKNKIENKIEAISNTLLNNDWQTVSLANGLGSDLLFYYYYLQLKNSEVADLKISRALRSSLNIIQEKKLGDSFAHGLTGIFWIINHIKDHPLIQNSDMLNIDDSFYQSLVTEAEAKMRDDNFDLFTGAIGSLMPIIDYKKRDEYSISIFKMFLKQGDGKWQSSEDKTKNEYNFGLAHGIPSIIVFLSLYSKAIKSKECYLTVKACLDFVLSTKLNESKGSLFPSVFKYDESSILYNSRLGWCYGDLGIANAFWQAGKVFGNIHWQKEAIKILSHSSKRKELIENLVFDCGLCHGTGGIAHIFNRFYKETKMDEFNDARWFWLNKTFELADFEDGLVGFKTFVGAKGYENDHGLIEGISGIGLVLMGFLNDDTEIMNWDRCLLLS